MNFEYNFRPTIIGSMPHTDPRKACDLVKKYLKDIPAWPQLPNRSPLESMTAQFSRGFPGFEIQQGNPKFTPSADYEEALERLYEAYLADDYGYYGLTPAYAAGFFEFQSTTSMHPLLAKGQVTGPISWCLAVSDRSGKAILYDEVISDAAARMLALNARWQEAELGKWGRHTLIMVDEPAMSSYGSAFFNLPQAKVVSLLQEVLGKLGGLKGIHCCGNTDWPLVLGTGIDVLSLDAFRYGHTLGLYPKEACNLIRRGGAVAWGIVPNCQPEIGRETVSSLKDRLEEAMAPLARAGLSFRQLASASLLTPSCSLAGLDEEGAEYTLDLLARLSDSMQKRYL